MPHWNSFVWLRYVDCPRTNHAAPCQGRNRVCLHFSKEIEKLAMKAFIASYSKQENDQFSKTGSGQTQGENFPRSFAHRPMRLPTHPAVSTQHGCSHCSLYPKSGRPKCPQKAGTGDCSRSQACMPERLASQRLSDALVPSLSWQPIVRMRKWRKEGCFRHLISAPVLRPEEVTPRDVRHPCAGRLHV